MKFREIFRFEFLYQIRRVSTWLYFGVLVVVAFLFTTGNSPFVIATATVFSSLLWLLVAPAVAGEAAARDVHTGMHALTYTAPVRKADYLGGRFLAAFVLNALILLAVPSGILLAAYSPGVEPDILGPFRPAAYLSAYAFIALPNAFVATAIQFSLAALNRRAMASYVGGVLLLVTAYIGAGSVVVALGMWELGKLLDPIGVVFVVSELNRVWTPIEKSTRLIELEGSLLSNRLLWLGIALGTLAFTHLRFRFSHPTATAWWSRMTRRRDAHALTPGHTAIARSAISIPQVRRTLGFATHARQTLAIAWTSFVKIATSRGGLVLWAAIAILVALAVPANLVDGDLRVFPRTEHVLTLLTSPLTDFSAPWVIIPLLIVFYAGELVWRERETGLSEIIDAGPVPEWVLFLGKFLGLSLVLVVWMALLTTAGVLAQVQMGYFDFEIGLYLRILFGLQLTDYLLFALLALVVHVLVNQKYLGHLVALIAYGFIAFSSALGIEHNLLVYGSDPGWSYTDMRGFGPFLGPWVWFKLYWAAWALMFAVVARLLWVRGKEGSLRPRFQLARRRFTHPTAVAAAAAVGLILTFGGFIFYNTNVLNEYHTASDMLELRAEYERRYGRYEGIPQPRLTSTNLHVEIYPKRREVDIRGSYQLVNSSVVSIDSIHVATPVPIIRADGEWRASEVEIGTVAFDRPAARVLADEDLGHRIYALEKPLQPGDSLQLNFEVHFEPHGFRDGGIDASVVANGTHFWSNDLLPFIGFQAYRELSDAWDRRAHGLEPRPPYPSLYDVEARYPVTGGGRIDFEAVVGTDPNQIAVAPGVLRRRWTEDGRRYFRYSTDAIGNQYNQYPFFSANYALHEGRWNEVAIQIFHHPGHAANLDRMVRSVRAALDYYNEHFGANPRSYIRLIERPGHGGGMSAEASMLIYQEGFSLLDPEDGPRGLFVVLAHEVGHHWGVGYAPVEGGRVLSEGLATYRAHRLVKETYGNEQLRRFLSQMWTEDDIPRTRATLPLLRALDTYSAYRKAPVALHALTEYIGEEQVNGALQRLREAHRSGAPPLATTLDLYRELQAVTPASLQYLLHDLFEANTWWELETDRVTAEQTEAGAWQVTLDVRARKVVVDTVGVETPVPMDDWVEIGVFASAEAGDELGEPIYIQNHRIRSGEQTITVTVPREPVFAGIDPYHLLDWEEDDDDDNIEGVEIEPPHGSAQTRGPARGGGT